MLGRDEESSLCNDMLVQHDQWCLYKWGFILKKKLYDDRLRVKKKQPIIAYNITQGFYSEPSDHLMFSLEMTLAFVVGST